MMFSTICQSIMHLLLLPPHRVGGMLHHHHSYALLKRVKEWLKVGENEVEVEVEVKVKDKLSRYKTFQSFLQLESILS